MQVSSDTEVYLMVDREGAESDDQDILATLLGGDLRHVDGVTGIERVAPQGSNAESAKSLGEIVTWGQLALTLFASHGVVVRLIDAIKAWLARQPPTTSVKLRVGKEEFEVKGADPEVVERLVRAVLRKVR